MGVLFGEGISGLESLLDIDQVVVGIRQGFALVRGLKREDLELEETCLGESDDEAEDVVLSLGEHELAMLGLCVTFTMEQVGCYLEVVEIAIVVVKVVGSAKVKQYVGIINECY